MAFPNKDIFEEYVERYKNRGNGESFIERRRKEFPLLVEMFKGADENTYKKIELQQGEYLSDILLNNNIQLQKK